MLSHHSSMLKWWRCSLHIWGSVQGSSQWRRNCYTPSIYLKNETWKDISAVEWALFWIKGSEPSNIQCTGEEVLATPAVSAKMVKVGVKKALNLSMSLSIIRRNFDLKFIVSRWGVENHTFIAIAAWGEFGPTREDLVVLAMLPIYGQKNAKGVSLSENDLGSWSIWTLPWLLQNDLEGNICLFAEGDESKSGVLMEDLLSNWLS